MRGKVKREGRCRWRSRCKRCNGRNWLCPEYVAQLDIDWVLAVWVMMIMLVLGWGFMCFCEVARGFDGPYPLTPTEYEERLLRQEGPWPGAINEFTGGIHEPNARLDRKDEAR